MQLNGKATIQIRIGLGFLDRRSYRMTVLVQIPIFYEMANLNFVEKEGGTVAPPIQGVSFSDR